MKIFTLTNKQVQFLHDILDQIPIKNIDAMRKMMKFFDCISDKYQEYIDKLAEIRKPYETEVERIENGVKATGMAVVKEADRRDIKKQVDIIGKKINEFACDREIFAVAKKQFEEFVTNNYKEKKADKPSDGMSGETTIRFFVEITDAMEDAKEQKK